MTVQLAIWVQTQQSCFGSGLNLVKIGRADKDWGIPLFGNDSLEECEVFAKDMARAFELPYWGINKALKKEAEK